MIFEIFSATRYTAEEIVTRKISREESASPPDTVVGNSGNNGGSGTNTLTGSPLRIYETSSWKLPSDQPQSTQHLSSPTSKLSNRATSPVPESLSQNSFQAIEKSPQRGREAKIQSLFPETKMALGLGSPKITPSTFTQPSDMKLNKDQPPQIRKAVISFAEGEYSRKN